ncbi:MAG TPA: hypothetical protein VHH36_01865 [Candidatus Thermoplasmatota archaeon]|nr:hypothetical protein [Candidatus Thermoplasmatota archaeon]
MGNWTGDLSGVGDQDTIRVPLRVANLTKLTARLTWIDDAPASGPDVLEVSVRGPRGRESDLAQGDAGFANATLQWRSAPFPAARDGALVLENATDESSFAEWRVVIRLYGTGATADAPDPGNAYVLRLFAESYRLETRVEGGAADRVALTLAPRGQVEYKFAMEENATMAYRWTATARVHSDLHADTAEDPETAVSAKVADLDGDSGDYRAPFRGRHGWYFRNDNAFPVTITLETRGDYRILGVVS